MSGGMAVPTELPAILGRIVKAAGASPSAFPLAKGRECVSREIILASGGDSSTMACVNNCSVALGALAVMTTPLLVLVTVPTIARRLARL